MVAGDSFMGSDGSQRDCHRVPAPAGANSSPPTHQGSAKSKIQLLRLAASCPGPGGAPRARLLPRFGYLLQGHFRAARCLGAGRGDNGAAAGPNPARPSANTPLPPSRASALSRGLCDALPCWGRGCRAPRGSPRGSPPRVRAGGTGRNPATGEMRCHPLPAARRPSSPGCGPRRLGHGFRSPARRLSPSLRGWH